MMISDYDRPLEVMTNYAGPHEVFTDCGGWQEVITGQTYSTCNDCWSGWLNMKWSLTMMDLSKWLLVKLVNMKRLLVNMQLWLVNMQWLLVQLAPVSSDYVVVTQPSLPSSHLLLQTSLQHLQWNNNSAHITSAAPMEQQFCTHHFSNSNGTTQPENIWSQYGKKSW